MVTIEGRVLVDSGARVRHLIITIPVSAVQVAQRR